MPTLLLRAPTRLMRLQAGDTQERDLQLPRDHP
jgi:hypothetical protein